MIFDILRDHGRHTGNEWIGWIEADSEEDARERIEAAQVEDDERFDFDLEVIDGDNTHSPNDEYA